MLYSFKDREPVIGKESYVSEEAVLIGQVKIGDNCFIGPGAVLRADYGTIEVGNCTAIEDNVVIHAPPGCICRIGSRVTIGHGAIIHCKSIGDYVMVGMGAILSIDAQIGANSVIAEGTVVRMRQVIPPSVIAGGNPAREIKKISADFKPQGEYDEDLYVNLAREYLEGSLKKIEPSQKS